MTSNAAHLGDEQPGDFRAATGGGLSEGGEAALVAVADARVAPVWRSIQQRIHHPLACAPATSPVSHRLLTDRSKL